MGAKIQIRPGAAAELPALVEALGQRPFFADRLARQHQGRGVLLVAWLDDHPVGDVYLLREPADVPKVRLHLPGVPQLDHLEVMGPLQRRGIGTALIHAGEDTARRLGDERLALGVGLANIHARRLYERLGYVDWGHGPVVGTWRAVGDDGTAVAVSQLIDLLVKHLEPTQATGTLPVPSPASRSSHRWPNWLLVLAPRRPGRRMSRARWWLPAYSSAVAEMETDHQRHHGHQRRLAAGDGEVRAALPG